MRYILLSLFSQKDNTSGIAVYDLDGSIAKYVQLVDFSNLPGRMHHVRGITALENHVYVVTPWSLLIYRSSNKSNGPGLMHKKTIIRPEWLLGERSQGNLHAVYVSKTRKRIYVSFNSQGAIDTFDLSGNFLERRYLWEIAPNIFPLPLKIPEKGIFISGLVSHIFENSQYGLMFITSLINGEKKGALIDYDSGNVILDGLSFPHGGHLLKKHLYLCERDDGIAHSYSWPIGDKKPILPFKSYHPVVDESRWPDSIQKLRGIIANERSLICGVCHYGKIKKTQIPPRLVEFDLRSGEQIAEHFLPSFHGLLDPQAYAICYSPRWLSKNVASFSKERYFYGTEEINPKLIDNLNPLPPVQNNSTIKADTKSNVNELRIENEDKSSDIEQKSKIEGDQKCKPKNMITTKDSLHKNTPNSKLYHNNSNIKQDEIKKDIKSNNKTKANNLKSCIILDKVGLRFTRKASSIFGKNKQLKKRRTFWALQDISFEVKLGEIVGVIGRNGSGKSTLSMICTGVYKPDTGKIRVYGKAQLLALGVGFKNELTGLENVFVSASLMGLSPLEIEDKLIDIKEFAELGAFINEPVRTYSSGMRSRLAFAVATAVQPDILILDEAMSVGDKSFQDKAIARMRSMREKAKSVIVVSHSTAQIKKLCNRVLWIERGRLIMDDEPPKVLKAYEHFCKNPHRWLCRHEDIAFILRGEQEEN